jgi:hypothetical protein
MKLYTESFAQQTARRRRASRVFGWRVLNRPIARFIPRAGSAGSKGGANGSPSNNSVAYFSALLCKF